MWRSFSATITNSLKIGLFPSPVDKTARTWFLSRKESNPLHCSTFKLKYSEILAQAALHFISVGHHFAFLNKNRSQLDQRFISANQYFFCPHVDKAVRRARSHATTSLLPETLCYEEQPSNSIA